MAGRLAKSGNIEIEDISFPFWTSLSFTVPSYEPLTSVQSEISKFIKGEGGKGRERGKGEEEGIPKPEIREECGFQVRIKFSGTRMSIVLITPVLLPTTHISLLSIFLYLFLFSFSIFPQLVN
jgi:hypothetical protein